MSSYVKLDMAWLMHREPLSKWILRSYRLRVIPHLTWYYCFIPCTLCISFLLFLSFLLCPRCSFSHIANIVWFWCRGGETMLQSFWKRKKRKMLLKNKKHSYFCDFGELYYCDWFWPFVTYYWVVYKYTVHDRPLTKVRHSISQF